ncbi:hypothetical protein Q1695_007260 [Nippostrongylus brasiliensis]|nr:hypothetical protein Q1695_007260 [Nippostrongylus brasiliensis]
MSVEVVVYLLCAWHFHQALCCVPTTGVTTTTTAPMTTTTTTPMTTTTTTTTSTTTTTTTTTTSPGAQVCCDPLTQTPTTSEFADGTMTFMYNDIACPTTVVANCSQTDPAFDLYAAIVANGQFFLDFGPRSITFPGTCNTTIRQWEMGDPPLVIQTLECRLTNPPNG